MNTCWTEFFVLNFLFVFLRFLFVETFDTAIVCIQLITHKIFQLKRLSSADFFSLLFFSQKCLFDIPNWLSHAEAKKTSLLNGCVTHDWMNQRQCDIVYTRRQQDSRTRFLLCLLPVLLLLLLLWLEQSAIRRERENILSECI